MTSSSPPADRDRGAILALVLVVAVVLSLVILALARFVAADLRYARVSQERAERQAAATSAITYGVERIRLGQTLCGSSADEFGTITPGLLDLDETTVELSCSRLSSGLSDITGWAVLLTGEGVSNPLLTVQGGGDKTITGPMFIDDLDDGDEVEFQGVGPTLFHEDGDLWHHRGTCPGAAVSLPSGYDFVPADARGPICTTSEWFDIVTAPAVPDLTSLPVNDGTVFTTTAGGCRVFQPGRYTAPPQTSTSDSYFESGIYYFDDIGTMEVRQEAAWFGHPGALAGSEIVANPTCESARDADPNPGLGAVAYFGGDSLLDVQNQGEIEFFPQVVDGRRVSLQALGPGPGASTVTAASGGTLVTFDPGSNADAVVRGLVWAPSAQLEFRNSAGSAQQKLLGGIVVARIYIQAPSSANGFEISVATTPFESDLVLAAEATSVGSGDSTTVRAVVEYRVDEPDVDDRVAINSLRVVDP